jgi:hypothetical protein
VSCISSGCASGSSTTKRRRVSKKSHACATRSNHATQRSAPRPNTDAHNSLQHSWRQFVQLWDDRAALILSLNSGSLCHNLSNTKMKARKNPVTHPSTPALIHRGRWLLTPPNTAASGTTHSATCSHLLPRRILADRIERVPITRIPRAVPTIAGITASSNTSSGSVETSYARNEIAAIGTATMAVANISSCARVSDGLTASRATRAARCLRRSPLRRRG